MPHQDQLPKFRPPVDLGVSAGPCPLERILMMTSIVSFDAPTIPVTKEPMNPAVMPVTAATQKPDNPENPVTPSTLYIEELSESVDKPSTLYEPSTQNIEEPVKTPIMASTPAPVGNPDDSLVIPRHPDPRVKLGYLGMHE